MSVDGCGPEHRTHLHLCNCDTRWQSTGRELVAWEGFAPAAGQTGRSAHPASKVEIPTSVIVTPFDCFYCTSVRSVSRATALSAARAGAASASLQGTVRNKVAADLPLVWVRGTDPPPQLAADGYRILNAAWTPLYIAGGSGQSPELIYKWNPWLLGEFPGHVSWWKIPREHRNKVVGVKMAVWSTAANDTLCSLSGRLPASACLFWHHTSLSASFCFCVCASRSA
eukprot:COSAG02_NODE_9264_length_2273_cov_2.781049_1_plen_226_part_00